MYSIRNSEQFRKNIRAKLNEKLSNGLSLNPSFIDPLECSEGGLSVDVDSISVNPLNLELISTNLEKSIFNYSIKEANKRMIIKKWENTKFSQLYIDRLRTIYLNLNNRDFIEKIVTMKIKPEEYAEITHQDIFPEKWKCLIEQNNKKEESLLSVNIKANTDLYTCRKCKSRNIYFTETQTRSADEQSTITLLCLTCGKRWTHG
jgi:transcription elongation factor S-II